MAVLRLTNLYNIIRLTSWARWSTSDILVKKDNVCQILHSNTGPKCLNKSCLLAFTDNQALERNCSFEVTAMAITNSSKYCYILVTSMQHLSPDFPHLLFLWFTARDTPSSAFHLVRMEIYTFVATCPSTLTSSD